MRPVNSYPDEIRLASRLNHHAGRARTLAARRLGDARAHAAAGSLHTAGERLIELAAGLSGHLADARAEFYRDAFSAYTNPAIHRDDVGPSADGEAVARTTAIGGRDQVADLAARIGTATVELAGATAAGGSALTLWEARHHEAIVRHVQTALSDAQMALHHAVGRVLVKEELQ